MAVITRRLNCNVYNISLLTVAILIFSYFAFRQTQYAIGNAAVLWTGSWLFSSTDGRADNTRARRPNIIFILADDYGFHDIGYRNPAMKTPNMDRLAAAGVKLDSYYVQPICTPSRAQLMSGMYQIHTGLQHSLIWAALPNCLPLDRPTIADKLREAGYATHMTGKWHVGYYKQECWPTRRGFQSFLGLFLGRGDHYNHTAAWYGYPFPPGKNWTGVDFREGESTVRNYTGHYSTHIFSKRAEDIIRSHNTNQPLFLYVSFQAVHEPLQVPPRYLEPFAGIKNSTRRSYMGMTYCMDEGIGNITAALKERGMWDNTVLVFSADNGGNVNQGASNWPLRGSKTTLWEGGIRAVGFVSSPLLSDSVKGTTNKGLIDISDWFPTLVEGVAGWSLHDTKVDGYNVWDTIKNGTPSPRREILHNIDSDPVSLDGWRDTTHDTGTPPFSSYMFAALRRGDWKIITGPEENNHGWYAPPESDEETTEPGLPPEKSIWLFNIKKDPNERHDLSDEKPGMVKRLLERLRYYQEGAVPVCFPDMDPDANPALHNDTWDSWR